MASSLGLAAKAASNQCGGVSREHGREAIELLLQLCHSVTTSERPIEDGVNRHRIGLTRLGEQWVSADLVVRQTEGRPCTLVVRVRDGDLSRIVRRPIGRGVVTDVNARKRDGSSVDSDGEGIGEAQGRALSG